MTVLNYLPCFFLIPCTCPILCISPFPFNLIFFYLIPDVVLHIVLDFDLELKIVSSWRTCSILNSQNAVPLCFTTKLIRKQQLQLDWKHVLVRINIQYYPDIKTSSLGTLNDMSLALLHTYLNLYSTRNDQGWRKNIRFTAEVWPPSPFQKNRN